MTINNDKTFRINDEFHTCRLCVNQLKNKNHPNGLMVILIQYWSEKSKKWENYRSVTSAFATPADRINTMYIKTTDVDYDVITSIFKDNKIAICIENIIMQNTTQCEEWVINLKTLKSLSAQCVLDDEKTINTNCKYCRPYCGEDKILYNNRKLSKKQKDAYVGIEVYIEDGNLNILSVADSAKANINEANIPINFCPICGNKVTNN